jgi:GT2 family glycosyltransferase
MQDKSLVTIICLCFNQEAYVIESLQSVIQSGLTNYCLIRCSSDDKSKSIIENAFHPEIHFIANQTNLGSTKSFNKALKVAQGLTLT